MGFVVKKMFGVAGFLLVCCFLMLRKNFLWWPCVWEMRFVGCACVLLC